MPNVNNIFRKGKVKKLNLEKFEVFLEEEASLGPLVASQYFNISRFPTVLPGGNSYFEIEGSKLLKPEVELKTELLDSAGQPIFHYALPKSPKSKKLKVTMQVTSNVVNGVGKLIIMGELNPNLIDIPEDFPDPNIAGKTSTFNVTISDVKSRVLPELDDEFAKSIGDGYEDLDDLKSQISESLQSEADIEITRTYRDSLIEALVETATLEIPPLLLKNEAEHMIQEQERMVGQANMVLDDYLQSIGKCREELEEESATEAETRLTRSFVLSKLAETEEIEVTDSDVEEKIKEMFANAEQEFPESSQSEEMKNYLRSNLRM